MHASTRNLLYNHPEWYELLYPEHDEATPKMVLRMFERFLPATPASLLDIGCGTARDLNALSRTIPDCWGFDFIPHVVAYAQRQRPHLKLSIGDMRNHRLGRAFDVVTCFGSTLMYALTNEDIAATLHTFAAHAHKGTLLLVDLNNAAGMLPGGFFREVIEFDVNTPELKARAVSIHSFDRRAQQLIRRRTWHIEGQGEVEDFCRYRMFFPEELRQLLASAGFEVIGLYDNKELRETDLTGRTLYVAARFSA